MISRRFGVAVSDLFHLWVLELLYICLYIWVVLHAKVPNLTQWLANPLSSQIWKGGGDLAPCLPYSAALEMRYNKNQPVRYSLVSPDHFSVITLWWQKNRKTQSGHVRLHARVAMEEGLLSVWVSQSIGQSQSVDENCYLLNSGFARTMS